MTDTVVDNIGVLAFCGTFCGYFGFGCMSSFVSLLYLLFDLVVLVGVGRRVEAVRFYL